MRSFAITFCVAVFLSLIVTAVSVQAQGYGSREALVIVEPIQFERESNRVEAVGTAEARRSVTLYPAVGDRVLEVNFKPGDRVKAGQILVRLDDRRQQVALQQAKLNLKDAERTVERLKSSFGQGGIAQSELDNAVLLRDLAEVELQRARTEVRDRKVIAPFDGVIGITDVEEGDRITEQTMIANLDDRDVLLIDFRIPEAAVSILQEGVELTVQPWRYSGPPVSAEVVERDSRINPQTRMFRARAAIDNSKDDFLPGTSFRTDIELRGREFVAVPEAALSWGPNAPYIWLAENQKAKRVPVQIEQRLEGTVLVSGDIQRDDLLIVEGVQNLRDDQNVKFQNAETVDSAGESQ
ncbi:efflux RND transporter periplasmic adaptor subunit [Idiomarina seosinensis]|uniref:efflux RND transporter periplasmic adaptor subunit n=1 Tax=Idiomarina seosinensis TaxID=281739 RepID=UPI00384DC784